MAALRGALDSLAAVGYGLAYDVVVAGFPPFEALVDEVLTLVARSIAAPAPTRVLDIACGTGTMAFRLGRAGYSVVGIEPVAHLVQVARRRRRRLGATSVSLHHLDLARGALPRSGPFDVVVSLHTLYWHDAPDALLRACRRALKPGGHAIILTYGRPAHVLPTFRHIWARDGLPLAMRALRWLLPTSAFEHLRRVDRHYFSEADLTHRLARAGFEVLECRRMFLAGLSLLAWARAADAEPVGPESVPAVERSCA